MLTAFLHEKRKTKAAENIQRPHEPLSNKLESMCRERFSVGFSTHFSKSKSARGVLDRVPESSHAQNH